MATKVEYTERSPLVAGNPEIGTSSRVWGARTVEENHEASSLSVRPLSQEEQVEPLADVQRIKEASAPVQKEAKKVNWLIFAVLFILTLPLLGAGGWVYLAYKKCTSADDQNQQVGRTAATQLSGQKSIIDSEDEFHLPKKLDEVTDATLLSSYSGDYTHTFLVGADEGTPLARSGKPIIVDELERESGTFQGATLTKECAGTLNRGGFAYPIYDSYGKEIKRDQFVKELKSWAEDDLGGEPNSTQPAAIAQVFLSSILLAPSVSKHETDLIYSVGMMPFDELGTHQVRLLPRENMQGTLGYVYTIESTRTVNMTSMSDGEVKGSYQVKETIEIAKQHSRFIQISGV